MTKSADKPRIIEFGHKVVTIGKLRADLFAILANFSTLSNLFLGLTVSYFIIINNPIDPKFTTRMIVLAASFDAIDGRFARLSNTKPRLGAQFDTAADQVSFAVAPALLIFHKLSGINMIVSLFLAFIYYFTASFRLSRFMLSPTSGYFSGMPSPVSAIFIAAWYLQPEYSVHLFAGSVVFISLLMISTLPYSGFKIVRSPAQVFYFIFTVSMMLALTYSPNIIMVTLGKIWIVYIIYFCIAGPMHARHNMRIDQKLESE